MFLSSTIYFVEDTRKLKTVDVWAVRVPQKLNNILKINNIVQKHRQLSNLFDWFIGQKSNISVIRYLIATHLVL